MDEKTKEQWLADIQAEAAATCKAIDRFPKIVEDYLLLTSFQQTAFGKATGGGIDFVRHLRARRDQRSSTLRRVLTYIADNPKSA